MNSTNKIIKHKTGLLNLAEELGNVSKACQVMGMSRDTFYRYKSAVEDGGVEALFERTRRKPNLANRVDQATEDAVIKSATDFPAYGQARTSNELRKLGVFVSPSGVRSIWLRHDLANFKKRLKALEAKVAILLLDEEGTILTEAQVQALEKKKLDDEACGEIETAHPGYLAMAGSRRAAGRVNIHGALNLENFDAPFVEPTRTRSMSAPSRALAGSTSRPTWTPIARWPMPNSTPPRRRSPRPTCSTTGCCHSTKNTTCRCCGS